VQSLAESNQVSSSVKEVCDGFRTSRGMWDANGDGERGPHLARAQPEKFHYNRIKYPSKKYQNQVIR
jgi:hypothetical protein